MVRALKTTYIDGRMYFIDLRLREFRSLDMPWTIIKFESRRGLKLCRNAGVLQCSECGAYSQPSGDQEYCRCAQCGLFFIPAEV